MDPFRIAFDALLRPRRFVEYLDGGWLAIRRCTLATLLWTGAALAFVGAVLPQLVALGGRGIIAGLALAPALALFAAGLGMMSSGGDWSIRAKTVFWLLRCQLAITPPLALFLALAFSNALAQLQATVVLVALLLLLFGVWAGGGLAVALVLHRRRAEAAAVRWVLACGAAFIVVLLWRAPVVRPAELLLLLPFSAGLAIGLLRPLSYAWEAFVSVALAVTARAGARPSRMLAHHPASYDDLCLLPLPGLRGLLARACAVDLDDGAAWLLRMAQHAGQRRAAEGAVCDIVRRGQIAHPLLFWLSTDAEGILLLRRLAEQPRQSDTLIAAYAALASVNAPEAWPAAVARHRSVFLSAADLPGGRAMLALLDTSAGILRADRWAAAIERLQAAPQPEGVESDELWNALERVKTWPAPLIDAGERAVAATAILEDLHDVEGWPAALLAAAGEHALFLIGRERRRGAWLL